MSFLSSLKKTNTPHPRFPGLFLSIEGADGCGKTTLVKHLVDFFEKHHFPVIQTREPGGCPFGEELRSVLFSNTVHPDTQLLALFASRLEHVESVIVPALLDGKLVISDRFMDSSYAYQVKGSGANETLFDELKAHIDTRVSVDLTLYVCASYNTLLKRTRDRSALLHGPFESRLQANPEFFEAVLDGFETCAEQAPERIHRINGEVDENEVFKEALFLIDYYVRQRSAVKEETHSIHSSLEFCISDSIRSFSALR